MGKASKKRYDSKYKVTRIWLADYIFLKELSQLAGISMAEALHRLIKPAEIIPVLPAQVTTSMAIGYRPQTTRATNGKAIAFRIKQKGVRYD